MLKLLVGSVVALISVGYLVVRNFDWLVEHDHFIADSNFFDNYV